MKHRLTALAAVLVLGGCATIPDGPGVMALPGTGKSFDQFRLDDANCRGYASAQTGGRSTQQVAADETARTAIIGAVIGALAGAAVGGSQGAGVGAGTGLVVGTAAGAGASSSAGWPVQRRYDEAFVQCMYAAGHKVPVSARLTESPRPAAMPPPPSSGMPPPPPSGTPPPPPPGVTAPR